MGKWAKNPQTRMNKGFEACPTLFQKWAKAQLLWAKMTKIEIRVRFFASYGQIKMIKNAKKPTFFDQKPTFKNI